ncbi:FGGY-family carbohydrate kinase [Frateuria aurantia]
MSHFLGIDIGTQSTKAVLVDADGKVLASASQGYQVDRPAPLHAEQWPEVWWQAVRDCIVGCTGQVGPHISGDISGICISSLYGGSGIPVDAQMNPLYPCLIWQDRRAEAEAEWVRQHIGSERIHAITGNGIDSYYGFTKMLWLQKHQPAIWEQTRYLLPPNSYIAWCLTGQLAIDHSSAGNIGGIYALRERNWSPELLAAMQIPAAKLPERLIESTDEVGRLRDDMADELGLGGPIPVYIGGVDAAIATFAAGVVRPGQHVAMLGTSMCWGYIDSGLEAPPGLVSFPYVLDGQRYLYRFGGALTAGGAVSWFRDSFYRPDHPEMSEAELHQLMETQAETTPAGAQGLLFLPYLMGERSPVWDARASAAFVGLGLQHGRGHMYRAVLEGVAMALRHNIEAGSHQGIQLDERLIVVGGAAHSDLWMQIIADITQRDIYTIEEQVEAAMGAALLAGIGSGEIGADAIASGWIHLQRRARPDPRHAARYEAMFELYRDLYPALKPLQHRLQQLG